MPELQIKTGYNAALAVDYLNLALEKINEQVINIEEIEEYLSAIYELRAALLQAIRKKIEEELKEADSDASD